MHISTKTGYALRAISELAQSPSRQPVSIKRICEKQHLPIKYIEQIFRKLKQHGLIHSIQGAKGGYLLAKSANQISLQDIMQAVDEQYSTTYCDHLENDYCKGFPCGFRELWDEIKDHLHHYFNSIKLDAIVTKMKE